MEKIVTIDMDIIMGPCINLYNQCAQRNNWDEMLKTPYFQLCKMDSKIMQDIIAYISYCAKEMDPENIYFIIDHDQILDFIDNNKKYNLINVDHHHDLGYNNFYDEVTCGNWVYHMHKRGNLENYMWIKNNNSDIILTDDQKKILTVMVPYTNSTEILRYNIPDKLFICLSPDFVPPEYQSWFYWILNIINTQTDKHIDIKIRKYVNDN